MDSKKLLIGVTVPGSGSNVNNGPQNNTGGKGGDCSGGGNAGLGGPGNGNNNITYCSKQGANDPKDSKKQPFETNKWDASGGDGLGTNVNLSTQTNVGGNGGTAYNGGNAGLGGPGNGNNNITYG